MYKRQSSDYMMDSSRPIGGGMVGGDYGFNSGGSHGFSSDLDSKTFSDFSSFPSGIGGSGGSDFYVGGGGINTGSFGGGNGSGRGFSGGLGGAPRGRGGISRGGGASRGTTMQGPNRGGGRFNGSSSRGSAGGSRGGARGGMGLGRGGSLGSQRGGASRGGFGGSGRGGSNTDTESGYLQDHQGHFPDEYWCKTCNAKTTGPENYKAHLMGGRHMQNMRNLEKGEPLIRTGPLSLRKRKLEQDEGPTEKKTLHQMLSKVTDPIVGLEYVTEIIREGNDSTPPDYNCELCTCRTLQGNIIFHLIGFRHRLAYINKHKPDIAAIIESVAKAEADEDKTDADGASAPKGTTEEDEERKNKSTRGKQSEKLKEFIADVAAECRGKKHKIKRVKAENIGVEGGKKAVPSQSMKGFQQNNPGYGKGRSGVPPTRGRGGFPSRGGLSTGFDRSSGGFDGRPGNFGGGRGGAVGGRGGALGGRGGALGGRGAAIGSYSSSLGSPFGSSPNGGGYGRGAGPARGGFGSSLSSGRTLDDDMGEVFSPRGRGRGFLDFEDTRDLGGGYDLPPPPNRRDADIEAIKTEILDSLKRDSVVSDAFILREFERRFGSTRRARSDAYDDYVDMPLPGGREPPLPTREILGFRDMARSDSLGSYDSPRGRSLLPPPPLPPFAGQGGPGYSRL